MARVVQNRLTHLLMNRSTPTIQLQVSQLHASALSQRFWNLLNLEHWQRDNRCSKYRDINRKIDCSRLRSEPRMFPMMWSRKPSFAELLSKYCRPFNDQFHGDEVPPMPYYRQRAPQLPRWPCSKAPSCPTKPPCPAPESRPPKPCPSAPKPCPSPPKPSCPSQPTCPSKSCVAINAGLPTSRLTLAMSCGDKAPTSPSDPCAGREPCSPPRSPNEPCRRPEPCNPRSRPKVSPPKPLPSKPYPSNPCESCPRKPSCPPPPFPCPRPGCPPPPEPCAPKSPPMQGCALIVPPTGCSADAAKGSTIIPNGIGAAVGTNQSMVKSHPARNQTRGFHGQTVRNNRSNDNSSVKKRRRSRRSVKKGKKAKPRKSTTLRSSGLSSGKIVDQSRDSSSCEPEKNSASDQSNEKPSG